MIHLARSIISAVGTSSRCLCEMISDDVGVYNFPLCLCVIDLLIVVVADGAASVSRLSSRLSSSLIVGNSIVVSLFRYVIGGGIRCIFI